MEITKYKCDLCLREYERKEEIVGDVSVRNGEDFMVFPWVCRACLRKTANFIRENFKGAEKPEVEPVKN